MDLVRKFTRMEVVQIVDGMQVRADRVHIIPPGRDLVYEEGCLRLLEPTLPHGQRLPIDQFFQSLAAGLGERSIGIVLSGTGSDGTFGCGSIKAHGGMVMAQSPDSTEYDGMPRSVLDAGLVDFELLPSEMPARLASYVAQAFRKPPRTIASFGKGGEGAMGKVFAMLRSQTGHDFSQYKPSTVCRRIERRMSIQRIVSLEDYVRYLGQTPAEASTLFRELLIGVTGFFRDAQAFRELDERAIAGLVEATRPGGTIRIWCAGCSTGEEAYSLAILVHEHLEASNRHVIVQIFATDIDAVAISRARTGRFPSSIASSMDAQRLKKHFDLESDGGGYRIHKTIRDMLVFSEHNLIKDPPFSRLDMISCRNLLIYFDVALQKKVFPLFHYALNPGGFLFLGAAETIGNFDELFAVEEGRAKIFRRLDLPDQRLGMLPSSGAYVSSIVPLAGPRAAPASAKTGKGGLRELVEQTILRHVAPASALVNARGDVLYLHGRTGMYLEPPEGESGVSNILKMAREGLERELSWGLNRVTGKGKSVRMRGLRVKTNGHHTSVDLTLVPVESGPKSTTDPALVLILFADGQSADREFDATPVGEDDRTQDGDSRIEALKRELLAKEGFLREANEKSESSNRALQTANEAMQSINEELQSTNEELETSKEELQSVNEELATVNTELQSNVADLTRANNDMNNLLSGTGIGTVFVDHQMRILRFTPMATKTIHLIATDLGRPIGHIAMNLVGYDRLVLDTQEVMDTLVPKEVNVRTIEGSWHTMRIRPYRTVENVVEGAVITFIDIAEPKPTMDVAEKVDGPKPEGESLQAIPSTARAIRTKD